MKAVLNRLLAKEELHLCNSKNIMDCPEYWTRLAVIS